MSKGFDVEALLETQIEGSLSTSRDPIPEGDYTGVVDDIKARTITMRDGDEKVIVSVMWNIDDAEVAAELGVDNLRCKQDLWVDLTDEGGLDLGKGKNIDLGRLREALGQNGDRAWTFQHLVGKTATLEIIQVPDKDDPDTIYNRVKTVTAR